MFATRFTPNLIASNFCGLMGGKKTETKWSSGFGKTNVR
jgi:hypothetical protein